MRVLLDNHDYRIEFEYGTTLRLSRREGREFDREITTCRIRDAAAPFSGDGTAPVIAEAYVVRYYEDPPNREVARKEALKKALSLFDLAMMHVPICFDELPPSYYAEKKSHRRMFWEAYLNRKRVPNSVPAGGVR